MRLTLRTSGPPGRSWLAALGLAIFVVAATHAQHAELSPNARDVDTWVRAVTQHVPGQHDEAVAYLARWATADLEALLPALVQIAPDEKVRAALVRRALILHADVAMFNRTTTGYTLPPSGPPTYLFADGKETGRMYGTFHWEFGRRLLERLPRGDERQAMARVYYRAVSAVLQVWGEHVELKQHLAVAPGITGNDPVLLMYEGTMHQAYADARAQRYFDELRQVRGLATTGLPSGRGPSTRTVQEPPPTEDGSRANAERLFRRALSDDPDLREARIRLAHVLHDRGRHDDAARELEKLPLVSTLPPFLGYYAAMLNGRIALVRRRIDDARGWFEQALTSDPGAQTPRLALSGLATASGDRYVAQRYLLVLTASDAADDPWWLLGRIHAPSAEDLVAALREVEP